MLRITISGETGTGKSTLARLVSQVLREHGINVFNYDTDVVVGTEPAELDQESMEGRVRAVAERCGSSPVVVNTITVAPLPVHGDEETWPGEPFAEDAR